MNVIGISGKKQSGKSFLAKNLVEIIGDNSQRQGLARDCNYKIVCMADALKQIVIDCFVPPQWDINMSPTILNSDTTKNLELPCGHTIRYLLQQIGTEMFRSLWSDVWLNAWQRKVAWLQDCTVGSFIICPDVRFPNELKAIHDMGGVVIRLTRAPFANEDQHESETALDDIALLSHPHETIDPHYILGGFEFIPGSFDYVMNNKDFSMNDARRWAKDFVTETYPDYV